jgi:hypothetical protein
MNIEWVKSVAGAVRVNGMDVSGAPVQVAMTGTVKGLLRDKVLILVSEPEAAAEPVKKATKKEARNDV